MTDSMLTVALRTAGRLAARGILTTREATEFIYWAWGKHSLAVMPAGSTSNRYEAHTFALAATNDLWCGCGDHRVQMTGTKCPSCLDDERRAS